MATDGHCLRGCGCLTAAASGSWITPYPGIYQARWLEGRHGKSTRPDSSNLTARQRLEVFRKKRENSEDENGTCQCHSHCQEANCFEAA